MTNGRAYDRAIGRALYWWNKSDFHFVVNDQERGQWYEDVGNYFYKLAQRFI